MRLAEASIDTFREAAALEAPCRPVVAAVALVLDGRVVEGTRTVLVVVGVVEEMAVLHEPTRRDPRRRKKNWMPRWRTTSTPTAGRQSLLPKPLPNLLLRPTERPLRPLTLMTLI